MWLHVTLQEHTVYQKDMCLKELGLHAQTMIIIVGSIFKIIGEGEGAI
jgi:hypothetical protein